MRSKIEGVVIFTNPQKDILERCSDVGIAHAVKEIEKDGKFMVLEMPDDPLFDLHVMDPYEYINRIERFKRD